MSCRIFLLGRMKHNKTKSDYIYTHFLHVTKISHYGYSYIIQYTRLAKENHKKLYSIVITDVLKWNSFAIGIWFLILLFAINSKYYIILQIPPSLHPLSVRKGCLEYLYYNSEVCVCVCVCVFVHDLFENG